MVRRLVEQHAIGPHEKDSREGHAHLPPPGQGPDVGVHHLLRKADSSEDLACLGVQRVAPEFFEARLRLPELLDETVHLVGERRGRELRFQVAKSCPRVRDRARAVERRRHDAHVAHLADVLAEVADGRAALDRDLAGVRLFFPHDHAKDGRLARAIGTNEPDLLTAKKGARGVHEENLAAVLFGDGVEANHEGRAS